MVTYYTDAPRINRTFANILVAFKQMRITQRWGVAYMTPSV